MPHYLESFSSLPQAFFDIAAKEPKLPVYSQPQIIPGQTERAWKEATFEEVLREVKVLATYLRSRGVKKGTPIAVISTTRPEWLIADFAALTLGGVVVSVYPSLPAREAGYILFDSESRIVFAENQEQVDKLLALLSAPCEIPATEEREAQQVQLAFDKIISFEAVRAHPLVTTWDEVLRIAPADIKPDPTLTRADLATLVYTSGTTGPPKGVIQTHGNHLANCRQACTARLIEETSRLMLFLPLAHSFAKLMGYLGFTTRVLLKFPAVPDRQTSKFSPQTLAVDFREAEAEIFPIVPRMLEKMEEAIALRAKGKSVVSLFLSLSLWSGARKIQADISGKSAGLLVDLAYALTRFIRRKIRRQLFGSRFRYAVSGGAKLSTDVAYFFRSLEIEVLEGYGLTETCVATNVNRTGQNRIGTVGPVLADDIEIKIADDGEILFKGPNITSGYFKRKKATEASWDKDGWFHTGDLGALDADRYLSIVGRKKELFVTSYGKKVAPESVEHKLKTSPYISQAVLLGDGKSYCVALIALDEAHVRDWATKTAKNLSNELHSDPEVVKLVNSEIARINKELASFESVKKCTVVPGDFNIENGMLTPTFKLKRKEITEHYKSEIADLYKGE